MKLNGIDVIRKRYAKFIGKENEWLEVTPILKTGKKQGKNVK